MANNEHDKDLQTGQEGTTGNDRGLVGGRHEMDRDHGTYENGTIGGSDAGTASMSSGKSEGENSSESNAAASSNNGGKDPDAAGNAGAAGDSMNGAQQQAKGENGEVPGNS